MKIKTIIKIILIIELIFITGCGTIKPNVMIGPTGDVQKTYVENIKYYK